jgi:glycosyltransferase 2 family protein
VGQASRLVKERLLIGYTEAVTDKDGVAAVDTPPHSNRALQYAGYALAIVGLVWVFHDFKPARLAGDIANVHWWWLVPAVACDIFTYFIQGERWARLLRPIGKLSSRATTEAIYAGLFVNEIMPLRLGELLRMYLVAARLRVSVLRVLPSVAFERLLDTLCLAAAIGPVALFVPLSHRIAVVADSLGVVAIAATVLAIAILTISPVWISRQRKNGDQPRPLFSFLSKLVVGMQEISRARQLGPAILLSFLFLFFQGLSFWFAMIAFGIKLALLQAIVVALVVRLGTAIPNAPANIGSYQLFCVLGLRLFDVEKAQAASFSVFVFAALTLPMVLIGAWVIFKGGLSLGSLRRDLERIRASVPA